MGQDYVGRAFYGMMDFEFNEKKFYGKFGVHPSEKDREGEYFDEDDWYGELKYNGGIEDMDGIMKKNGSNVMVSTTFMDNHHFVCIRDSHMKIGNLGFREIGKFPRTISLDEWDALLKEFCDDHGIEWKQPSWVIGAERW